MGIITIILSILIIVLDLIKKINITRKKYTVIYMTFMPHIFITIYLLYHNKISILSGRANKILFAVGLIILYLYCYLRIMIIPEFKKDCNNLRVNIAYDGSIILRIGVIGIIMEILTCTAGVYLFIRLGINTGVIVTDVIISIIINFTIVFNGSTRILVSCKRMGIVRRLLVYINLWIPVVNIFLMLYMCQKAEEEYAHACDKLISENLRVESNVCSTRYPIIMVHGIGFRDVKYLNYWGRIPKNLIKNGAKVYYGHQEAWGTIEDNANEIKNKIYEILKENNCEKVNIIAHSKGGLDSRYLISKLNMGQYVASLTTISTPHRGSQLIDVLDKLPNSVYRKLSSILDRTFKKVGDKDPCCYRSSQQLSPAFATEFNEKVRDDGRVYYQSYASIMKNAFSDSLLSIPYFFMRCMKSGDNDGLVAVESAKWGNFRGIEQNQHLRGISHGDIIDLKREDYKGYDPVERYIDIVSDLKKHGF